MQGSRSTLSPVHGKPYRIGPGMIRLDKNLIFTLLCLVILARSQGGACFCVHPHDHFPSEHHHHEHAAGDTACASDVHDHHAETECCCQQSGRREDDCVRIPVLLDTADDITMLDELHVEVGRVYHYQLESRDVLHNFSVPVFRLKQDAIPGRRITGWFEPTRTGEHDIQCAEICGIGHGVMGGRIFIEDALDHANWLASNAPDASGEPPPALARDANELEITATAAAP